MNVFKLIKEDFANVKKNDPALHSAFELFFNYPGLWALFFYRIANSLYRRNLRFMPRFISGIGQFLTTIDIHPGAKLGRRVFIDHGMGVVIGETSIIGDNVIIYQQVTLGGVSTSKGKRHPTLEDGVIVGAGAKILGNITIGKNSKIGANSVVVKNIPPNSTAAGIPARAMQRTVETNKLSHDNIPDINRELFKYLIKKVAILEGCLPSDKKAEIKKEEDKLDKVYEEYIKSLKGED